MSRPTAPGNSTTITTSTMTGGARRQRHPPTCWSVASSPPRAPPPASSSSAPGSAGPRSGEASGWRKECQGCRRQGGHFNTSLFNLKIPPSRFTHFLSHSDELRKSQKTMGDIRRYHDDLTTVLGDEAPKFDQFVELYGKVRSISSTVTIFHSR